MDTTIIKGDHTVARILLPNSEIEDALYEQVEELTDHEAFTEPITLMPDAHFSRKGPVGFTMPLPKDTLRVVPNIIGSDIGCFDGSTKVPLLDGESYEIQELADRDESFVVYSCMGDGEIVAAEATAQKTREDSPLVEVELRNGDSVECTPDHEFMLRDGTYKEAQDLESRDSLMPLYRAEDQDGYTTVHQNKDGQSWQKSHWIVGRSGLLGDIPSFEDQMTIIHHENFVKSDNRPENLTFMGSRDHSSLHSELSDREHWQSEEFEEKRIEGVRQYCQSEEGYKERSQTGTENITTWMEENPEEFQEAVRGNGQRGKKYLKDFNTSERACDICGEVCDNPASEYWHQVRNHPEETEYTERQTANHKVKSVTHLDKSDDVYCLTVPKIGNFALDIGVFVHNCGMTSVLLKDWVYDDLDQESLDQDIREAVPVGRGNVNSGGYHLHNEFPFGECNHKLRELTKNLDREAPDWWSGYDPDYFDDLCERCGIDINYAINSMGSLGGGNHFIEIGRIPRKGGWLGKLQRLFGRDWYQGEWVTVHSGSRKVGENVAEYWQDRAHENCDDRAEKLRERFSDYPQSYFKWSNIDKLSDSELLQWVTGGMGEDFLDMDAIREDYLDTNPEMIEETRNDIKRGIHDMSGDGNMLDYLEGEEAMGYLVDMIFAQTYAEQSRQIMAERTVDAMGGSIDQRFNSTHNYIDMDDLVIRKGATRLHDGEFAIVPMNMRDGVFLLEGRGNSQYNGSICHGAGRPYSRGEAKRRYGEAEVDRMNEEIFSTHIPVDELPEAYKDTATVKPYIEEGAKIVGEIEVLHNIKG